MIESVTGPKMAGHRVWRAAGVAASLLLLLASPGLAANYGNVEVTVDPQSLLESSHGYSEVWVRVVNRSKDEAHQVRLSLPYRNGYSSGDHLRAVSRTIQVEPGSTVRVSLAYPIRLSPEGDGLAVAIDGRDQAEPIKLDFSRSSRARSSGAMPTVLQSLSVDPRFPAWIDTTSEAIARIENVKGTVKKPKAPAPELEDLDDIDDLPPVLIGVGAPTFGTKPVGFIRAPLPAANWSPNWLGYSQYDGIVLTSADLRAMPEPVRSAIGQYVECGGSLVILGTDPPLPGKWKLKPWKRGRGTDCEAGFGSCFVISRENFQEHPWQELHRVIPAWTRSSRPWASSRTAAQANVTLPIMDDAAFPIGGLLLLMYVFAILAGPVTLFVIARRGRKLWLYWIIPVISAVTCVIVFGYMAISEGWSGRSRVVGVTILDENSRRASSLGWAAFYTPLSSGSGLHFSETTEVNYQNGADEDYRGYRRREPSAGLTIDWTTDQHLASGWITPRVPSHFVTRKSETRRERVIFSPGASGQPEAVNGLGVDLTELWYRDDRGQLFRASPASAGAKVSLEPATSKGSLTVRSFEDVYVGDWSKFASEAASNGPTLLKPRMYMAIMDAAPFFDDPMPNATRRAQTVVFGIIREGGDEN